MPLPPLPPLFICVHSQTRAELLHKQNAQMKELRRKQEAEQHAAAGAASDTDGVVDPEQEEEREDGNGGGEADDDDAGGVVAGLRKVRVFTLAFTPCGASPTPW